MKDQRTGNSVNHKLSTIFLKRRWYQALGLSYKKNLPNKITANFPCKINLCFFSIVFNILSFLFVLLVRSCRKTRPAGFSTDRQLTNPNCTAARSCQDSWASPAKKIRPLEKKLGRNPLTPPNHLKKCSKNFCMQIIGPIFDNYC